MSASKGWRIPSPDPFVSECLALIQAARSGDAYAHLRCKALFKIKLPSLPVKPRSGRPKKAAE